MNYVNLLDILYPVGSVYLAIVDISPSSFIGGTWIRIEGGAALRCGVENIATYVGNDTHTLTVSEMPSHSHDQYTTTNINGGSGAIRIDYNSDGTSAKYAQCTTGDKGGNAAHSIIQYSYNIYGWVRIN